MEKRVVRAVFAALVVTVGCGSAAFAGDGLLDFVNTRFGTASKRADDGNAAGMVPAVSVPFGGVKWVPMTRLCERGRVSYLASDPKFLGFIGTRQPSPWMGDFGQFSVMARVGEVDCDYATRGYPFDRAKCVFTPYYCKIVDGKGVVSEVTASSHAAWMRFTFPKDGIRHLVLDASRRFTAAYSDRRPFPGGVTFDADRRVVRAWNTDCVDRQLGPPIPNWRADVRVDLSVPYARCGTYLEGRPLSEARTVTGDQCGGWVEFGPEVDSVTVRVATSTVGDPEGVARRELGGDDFDATVKRARAQWAEQLSVVDIDADDDVRRIFATAMHHALMYPVEFSEGGRYYSGFDDRIHEGTRYTSFSLWDTYRAEHPFLTIFAPDRVDAMIDSLLQMYREGGYLPKWPNLSYTGIMVGGPAEIVIAEAYRKGFRGFDLKLAYEAVKKNATVPAPSDATNHWVNGEVWCGSPEPRAGLTTYQKLGYVASDCTEESVSRTQDFGQDDLAAAVLADAVGRPDEAAFFRARSKNYTNLWNAAKGTFWPKLANGRWAETAPEGLVHPVYTEQNKWTAAWCVPYDVPGLMALMGGRDEMERRLDGYFDNVFYRAYGGQMSEHQNEPTHHIAYLYAAIGCHDKCARQVRRIMTTCYAPDDWGMEGNDDCGQMSAWYVFSALGFYPLDPTTAEYVIGSPLVRRAEIRIGRPYRPAVFKVVAHNQSRENGRVRRVLLNGVELRERRLRHADLVAGGTLEFEMEPDSER